MSITVYSPYNGQPVEVRENDVGRAVKDKEGRTFYVLAKSDGSGYYGAMTRAGGQKDEDRALEMEFKAQRLRGRVDEELEALSEAPRRRAGNNGTIFVLVFLGVAGGMIWYAKAKLGKDIWQKGPPANPIVLENGRPAKESPASTGGAENAGAPQGGKSQFDPYAPLPPIPDGNVQIKAKPIDSAPITPGSGGLMNHGAPVKASGTMDGAAAVGPGKPLKSAPTTAPSTAAPAPK